jgi:membrane associated rhomboid family serine protease
MFILFPVAVSYETKRWPVVTFTLMGLCTISYALSLLIWFLGSEAGPHVPIITTLGIVPSQGSFLTWFSHMFVHAGLFHLLGNMVYLFLFGSVVEDTIGRAQFVTFYLVGGLAAAAVHIMVAGTSSDIPMVGASGAISACLGGFLILHSRTQIEFKYFFWIFPFVRAGEFFLASWVMISLWFLIDFLSLFATMNQTGDSGGVAFGAHVGGMLAGFGMMFIMKQFTRTQSTPESMPKAKPRVRAIPRQNVYVFHNEEQIGPFSKGQVRQMLKTGSLQPNALYWMDGMIDWLPVHEL